MILPHITLNTGHTATHRLDTLDAGAVAACADLLPHGGPVPGFPAFRVEIHEPVFTLFRGREPLLTCALCTGDDDTHQALRSLSLQFAPLADYKIPRGPWLAVVLLPPIVACAQADLVWLGDFERCLAAALLTQDGNP